MDFGGQGFSFNFGSQPQSSPQKKAARQEDKTICIPATIKMVNSSVQNAGSEELHLHGEEVGMLVLVGVVESCSKQVASIDFVLNDSTGRIKVRKYLTDAVPQDDITTGQYVTVVGQARKMPECHISAQFIHLIESPDEISYHNVSAVHTMLSMTKKKNDPMTPGTKRAVASPQSSGLMVQSSGAMTDTLSPQKAMKVESPVASGGKLIGAQLKAAVLSYLQQQGAGPEGLKLGVIAKQLEPSTATDVRSCLETLVTDGEIFNTIDDEHFGAV